MLDYLKFYPKEQKLRQLLLTHSTMVAEEALEAVGRHPELHLDADSLEFIREAAMLHDIGIAQCDAPSIYCKGTEPYIRHGVIGRQILEEAGLPRHALVCERHTGSGITAEVIRVRYMPLPCRDMLPISIEEKAICYADKFYSKSGDPTRRKSLARAIASIAKFGRKPLERFLKLHRQFG